MYFIINIIMIMSLLDWERSTQIALRLKRVCRRKLHRIKCDLGSIASASNDRTWLETVRRERRKFINTLHEPIIILSNSAAGVELINHGKVMWKQDRKKRREKPIERRGKENSLCPDRELLAHVSMREVSLFTSHLYLKGRYLRNVNNCKITRIVKVWHLARIKNDFQRNQALR